MQQAINAALNVAVPSAFRRDAGGTLVPKVYTALDNPLTLLTDLKRKYAQATPNEKQATSAAWRANWNPSQPIETMFNTLEEIYVQSIEVGPAFTELQLVDRALDQIKQTALYMTACI